MVTPAPIYLQQLSTPAPGSSVQENINWLIAQINKTYGPIIQPPSNVDITGGQINGTAIGNITPSTGNFSALAVAGDTVVTISAVQTLTNKTLTSPAINGGTIAGATINSSTIGATTPASGVFTSLSSTSGALNGTVGATTPAAGTFTALSSTSGALNGTVGATTPAAGTFTALSSTSGALNGSIGATTPNTGSFTTLTASSTVTLPANSISFATLAQGSARSVLGVAGNASANLASIQGTADQVLVVNTAGTALAFGTVATGGITANAVTDAKLRQGAALSVIGNATNGTANVADIAAGSDNQVLRRSGTAIAFGAVNVASASAVTGIMAAANGGTNNGFTQFSGPAASTKTFTLPNASDTIACLGQQQAFTAQQNFSPAVALTDAASIAWNVSTAQVAKVTLGGNRTMAAPSNLVDGGTYVLRVSQDGTGSRTLAYNAVFKWPGGIAPVLSTGINALDILTFVSDGTNLYGVIQKTFS